MQDLQDREVVTKLFDTIAPRFAARPGGYTRLLRIGFRRGDSAEVAQVELVGSEFDPRAKAEADAAKADAKPKAKGVGGRLRAAAERLRGSKKDDDDGGKKAAKPSKGVGAQVDDAAEGRRSVRSYEFRSQNRNSERSPAVERSRGFFVRVRLRLLTSALQTSSTSTPARSAFAAAMIFVCRCAGTSS